MRRSKAEMRTDRRSFVLLGYKEGEGLDEVLLGSDELCEAYHDGNTMTDEERLTNFYEGYPDIERGDEVAYRVVESDAYYEDGGDDKFILGWDLGNITPKEFVELAESIKKYLYTTTEPKIYSGTYTPFWVEHQRNVRKYRLEREQKEQKETP